MNYEEQEKIKYCDAINGVHAPDSLVRKVRNMNRQSKVKTYKGRKLAYVAAALAAVFVSSNVVTYAATGSTWVEKLTVKINGVEQEVDVERISYIQDGVEYEGYMMHIDEDESNSMSMEITDEIPDEVEIQVSEDVQQ